MERGWVEDWGQGSWYEGEWEFGCWWGHGEENIYCLCSRMPARLGYAFTVIRTVFVSNLYAPPLRKIRYPLFVGHYHHIL